MPIITCTIIRKRKRFQDKILWTLKLNVLKYFRVVINMFNYKIITDSTSGISLEEAEKLGITVVPLTLSYKGKNYRDGIDISTDAFYELFFKTQEKRKIFSRENKDFPKTSMVPPALFEKAFKDALDEGKTPVFLGITSVLSGTFQSANLAKDLFDEDIIVIDSQTALGCVKVIIKSILMEEYETKEKLLEKIDYLKKHVNYLAVMDTLEYVAKGGRMSRFSSILGNLFHFKPIMQLDYRGVIVPVSKPRGLKHAFAGINELLVKDPIDFNYPCEFGYSTQIENVQGLIEACKPNLSGEYTLGQISPVIGVHVGPGASALFYISTHEVDKKLIKE